MLDEVLKILPYGINEEIKKIGSSSSTLTEIRCRARRRVIAILSNVEVVLNSVISIKDILEMLIKISKNSLYAIQNDINNGFIVINGGHRVGICGEVVIEDGKIKNIKNINSLNIRIARQMIGSADKIMPYILKNNEFKNTLIVSPPRMW